MTQQSNFSGNPTNDQWQKGQAGRHCATPKIGPTCLAQHFGREKFFGKFTYLQPGAHWACSWQGEIYRKNWVAWKNGTRRRPVERLIFQHPAYLGNYLVTAVAGVPRELLRGLVFGRRETPRYQPGQRLPFGNKRTCHMAASGQVETWPAFCP